MRTALRVEDVRAGATAFSVEGEDIDAAEQRGLLNDARRKVAARATHGWSFYRPGLTTPVPPEHGAPAAPASGYGCCIGGHT